MRLRGSVERSGTEDGTHFTQRFQSKNIMTSGNYGKFVMSNFMKECFVYIEDMIHDVVTPREVREFHFVFDYVFCSFIVVLTTYYGMHVS